MREELVLKAAVLAERFYPDLRWYVDVMLQLIERAGEFASKDVWHSTVQLITAYPELHEYSTRKARPRPAAPAAPAPRTRRPTRHARAQALEALQRGAAHEALVCCAGYLLGEYGRLVADVPAHMQFALLQERFVAASSEAKARARPAPAARMRRHGGRPLNPGRRRAQGLLLTTYMKLLVADPGDAALREGVQAVFERYARCARGPANPAAHARTGAPAPSAPAAVHAGSWTPTCSSAPPSTWRSGSGRTSPRATWPPCRPGRSASRCCCGAWPSARRAPRPPAPGARARAPLPLTVPWGRAGRGRGRGAGAAGLAAGRGGRRGRARHARARAAAGGRGRAGPGALGRQRRLCRPGAAAARQWPHGAAGRAAARGRAGAGRAAQPAGRPAQPVAGRRAAAAAAGRAGRTGRAAPAAWCVGPF